MDEFFTAEERSFRDHVRSAIADMLPEHLAAHTRTHLHMTRDTMAEWNGILHQRGWSAHHWPKEFGGPGWTPIQRFIFESELARADAPPISVFGIYLVGPTLYSFGT
ncbi:acyl-CoA dehydrogenase family protein, partial [Hoeflea sp.]|uniref:acyl-CoA dehydrogenase family protein n=1 Tax=Hoeflea sp. TaxID=1940281 RepID=UPI0019872F68